MSRRNDHSKRNEPFFSEGHASRKPGETDEALANEGFEAEEPDPELPAGEPAAPELSATQAAAEPTAEQKLARAEAKIAALEAEAAQLKDQLLRALAEAENTRRRARKEVEDTAKYAVANLAKDLLAAPDNLRRALDNIPAERRQADALLDRLAKGVELVERDLHAIFERYGITKFEPLGQPFDHNLHQALFEVPTADHPAGTVVQVLAPGYLISDRLLRPAMVAVAKAPGAGPAEGSDDAESGQAPGQPVDTAV
jgi:molecular chaperone GrpE